MTVRTIRISIAAFYAVWKIDGRDMLSRLRCCGHFAARLGEPGVAEHGRDNEAHKLASKNVCSAHHIGRYDYGSGDGRVSVAESTARPCS